MPFKLRRTKADVLTDLPEKVEDLRYCEPSEEQVKLYREINELRTKPLLLQLSDEKSKVPYLHIFSVLHLLKQLLNHPALLEKDSDYRKYTSGKFELFKEILAECISNEKKVVVFSQYVGMIKIMQDYCRHNQIKYVSLTGSTSNRGEVIKQFQQDPTTKVFLGSLLAGGIGIDLTAASVVIHYDRWWNPSKENQATDRIHRIGQKNFVQVFKFITKGTMEEKIDSLINEKAKSFQKLLESEENTLKSLSRNELLHILS